MKITGSRVNEFLRRPKPEIAAVLLFGPDQGLVHERAGILAGGVVEDLNDPFRVAELTGQAIKSDPTLLADEAAQLSMTGGRRVIWVTDATDGAAGDLQRFLETAPGGNLVIVEAGNLGPRSSLRKLFEKAGNGASIGCYEDSVRDLAGVINETLGRHGLKLTPDALSFLAGNLGGDRLVTRGELEKLALYVGENASIVTLEDAMACVGDSGAMSLDAVAYAVASGDSRALDRAIERALLEGISPIGVLRAVSRHLQRLHQALGMVEGGMDSGKAIAALKPQVIFKFEDEFRAQVRRWRTDRLAQAMALVTEAEADCKSTGFPAVAGCHRALIRIAQMGAVGRRAV